jgi:hypothetical protein
MHLETGGPELLMSQSIFILDLLPGEARRVSVDHEVHALGTGQHYRLTLEGQQGHRVRLYFSSLEEVEDLAKRIESDTRMLRGERPV